LRGGVGIIIIRVLSGAGMVVMLGQEGEPAEDCAGGGAGAWSRCCTTNA
jgi:hypothetical protein